MDATKIGSIEREQMRDLAEKKSEETLLGKTINASRAIDNSAVKARGERERERRFRRQGRCIELTKIIII